MSNYSEIEQEAINYYCARFSNLGGSGSFDMADWALRPGDLPEFGYAEITKEEEEIAYAVHDGKMIVADVDAQCLYDDWAEKDTDHPGIPWEAVEVHTVWVDFYHHPKDGENFGSVVFGGKKFALMEQAWASNRADEQDGNYYLASAMDEDGNEFVVLWEFYDLEEGELEEHYPWPDPDFIVDVVKD